MHNDVYFCDCSARHEEAEPAAAEHDAESGSDLAQSEPSSRKRGRRSSTVGKPLKASPAEEATTAVRKRPKKSEPTDDDTEDMSLLSPSTKGKAKGRVSASGLVVSAKDGRVLSKHLELKQMFGTGYRNPANLKT